MIPPPAVLAPSAERSRAVALAVREGAAQRHLAAALGGPEEDLARAAAAVLADAAWVADLLRPLVAALADDPWFEPPFRAARDPLRMGALLYDDGRVALTASVLSAAALAAAPEPATVVLPGRLTVTRYHHAGGVRLRRWRMTDGAAREIAAFAPEDGAVVTIDGRDTGVLMTGATGDVVTVTATLRPGQGAEAREFRIADGRPARSATLDEAAARTQMLLAYLRLDRRADAGRCFAAAAAEGPFFLRWAAMREWLALDAAAALPALERMARHDPHGEVRAAAVAMLPVVADALSAAERRAA